MKNKLYWLLAVVLCVSTFGVAPQRVLAQRGSPPLPSHVSYRPGEMIVVYRQGLGTEFRAELSRNIAEAVSGTVLKMHGNAALLSVDKSFDVPGFTREFGANLQAINPGIQSVMSNIAYAQPNYIFDVPEPGSGSGGVVIPKIPRPNDDNDDADVVELKKSKSNTILPTYPEDPYLYDTWGWWNTSSDVVWQDKTASPMICLLDTGVDVAHPDLAGRIINGWDVVNDDPIPDDDNGHGTHVAGVLAAKPNNKIGIAGASNAKIWAVKVLDSHGVGDSWDIKYGLERCADNPAVKIINMSFGTYYPDSFLFEGLNYAIVTQRKLVVAAAGNDSHSGYVPVVPGYPDYLIYPAAWAGDFVCEDGYVYLPPAQNCRPASGDPFPNTLTDGLISVGASRSYWSTAYDGYNGGTQGDGLLWVDTNGNGAENSNEHYYVSNCAADFTNFGAWVSIVAPGENITSTVPVSYPYYQQYRLNADSDGDGYDTWNGTSMATPFVTATAARVWSLGNSLLGAASTNSLVKERLISTGYSVVTAVDPNANAIYDGYYEAFSGEAPYCWPNANLGTFYDMSNVRILNAADAMNRATLFVYLYNAINGLPLKGATVGAYIGTTAKSQALMNSNFSPVAILPNLTRNKMYNIQVNKTGFTNGQVTIKNFTTADYAYQSDPSLSVGVPPMGKITGVLDWVIYDSNTSDMDLYAWLPQGAPNGGGAVGYNLGSAPFIGKGRLLNFPYARWNLDGGTSYDWAGTESISIKPRPGFPTMPYYNVNSSRHYDFLVHEWETGALNNNDIFFRVWVGGKIKAIVIKNVTCGPGEVWWKPVVMQQGQFIVTNTCGTGAGNVWPY